MKAIYDTPQTLKVWFTSDKCKNVEGVTEIITDNDMIVLQRKGGKASLIMKQHVTMIEEV